MNLIERAKKINSPSYISKYPDEYLELAVAWARGEVKKKQALAALKEEDPTHKWNQSSLYVLLYQAVRAGII